MEAFGILGRCVLFLVVGLAIVVGYLMTHPSLGDKPFRFHVNVHGKMMGDYVLGAKYLDEFQPFYEFYRSRFVK